VKGQEKTYVSCFGLWWKRIGHYIEIIKIIKVKRRTQGSNKLYCTSTYSKSLEIFPEREKISGYHEMFSKRREKRQSHLPLIETLKLYKYKYFC
jgi:hypothetical protein